MRLRAMWRHSVRGRGWRDVARRAARSAAAIPQSRSSQQLRSLLHLGDDAREDIVRVALAIDQCKPLRLGDGKRSISLANAAMKPEILRLEPSLILYGLGIPRASASQSNFFRQIEKEREVRRERIGRPGVERPQLVEVD